MNGGNTDFFLKDKFKTGIGKKSRRLCADAPGWAAGHARTAMCGDPPAVLVFPSAASFQGL